MTVTSKPSEAAPIVLPKLNLQRVQVTLIGDSPLICHAWSQKAKRAMLDKQMKRAAKGKEAKNPEQDYIDSLYRHPEGGYGFPTVAFKAAAVDACSQVDGLTKVSARAAFHIDGELVHIDGAPTMREDMVRVGLGTADIRYRGEFKQWRTTFEVVLNAGVMSLEQLVGLFDVAGFGVGVGEWRPQRDGGYGRFHVAREGEA